MKSVVDKDYEELEIKDDWNKKYDFEMQTGMYEEIPKRSRYYQSLIDSDCLNKGVLYRNLPDSLICFICMKDPLGDETPNEDNDNISYIVDKDDSYDAAWCEFIPVDDADTYFQTYLDLADHWKKYYTRYESDDTLMFVIYEGGASEQYLEYYNAYKVSDDVIFLYHGWYTLGSDMDDFIETHRKSCQEAFTVKVNGHVWKPTAKERKASKSLNKSIDKLVSSKTKTITSDVTKGLDIYGKHHKEWNKIEDKQLKSLQ